MASLKIAYSASSNLTVTNLHSLAASSSYIAGWGSATVDNTSALDVDHLVSAKFTITSSNNQAGEVRIYIIPLLDDSNYPSVSSGTVGTEGAVAFVDTEERDAAAVLARTLAVDASTGAVIFSAAFSVASLFGGVLPKKYTVFVTGNAATSTNAQFAASGNQVTYKGVYYTVA